MLEGVLDAENSAHCIQKHSKKRQFMDTIKRAITPHGTSKQLTESAVIASVKLCKASTYISPEHSLHVVSMFVQHVISDLKVSPIIINEEFLNIS